MSRSKNEDFGWVFHCNITVSCWVFRANGSFPKHSPALRTRVCRLLAAKSTLAARVDSARGDPTGKIGRDLREEIRKKIDKWQEPPPQKWPEPHLHCKTLFYK